MCVIERARAVRNEVYKRINSLTIDILGQHALYYGFVRVQVLGGRSPLHHDSSFLALLKCAGDSDYSPLQAEQLSAPVVEHALARWADAKQLLGDAFLEDARHTQRPWAHISLQFALFHASLAQLCASYYPLTASAESNFNQSGLKAIFATTDANLRASTELFMACHELEPSKRRLHRLWDLYRNLKRAIHSEPIAVARAAVLANFPEGGDAGYASKYLYHSTYRTDYFNWKAKDEDAATQQRAYNCLSPLCNGVFLSTTGTCNTCDVRFCLDCHAVKPPDGSHECLLEDKESIAEIANTTKPCPKCLAAVYKLNGCDQMMCTLCHTMFLFSSGELVKRASALHNRLQPRLRAHPHAAEQAAAAQN